MSRPGGNPGRTDQGQGGGKTHPGRGPNPHPTRRNHQARSNRINMAVTSLTNALIEGGLGSNSALRFARMALTQKGVQIGRGGAIRYKGSRYTGADFAKTGL